MAGEQCYFFMADGGQSAQQLAPKVLRSAAGGVDHFSAMNGIAKGQTFKGQILIHDGYQPLSQDGLDYSKQISDRVNYSLRNRRHEIDPKRFNNDFDVLNILSNNKDRMAITSKVLSTGSKIVSKNFSEIQTNLERLDSIYKDALRTSGKLRTPQFQGQIQTLSSNLQRSLRNFSGALVLPKPDLRAGPLKDSLGISHKSLEHNFKINGGDGQIKPLAGAIEKSSKLASAAKQVGNIAKVISIGNSVVATTEDFKTKGAATGFRTMGKEAAGHAGSMVGAELGMAAAILVIGTATGGVGFVAIGIGALAGGYLGKELSQGAYDGTGFVLDRGSEAAMDWWFK